VEAVDVPSVSTQSTYDQYTGKGFKKWSSCDSQSVQEEQQRQPESVLQEAHRIINGERAQTYGDSVYNDFKTIGELWSVVINSRYGTSVDVSSDDVAMMMLLLKVARAIKNTSHRDSLVDVAGYAGCAAKLRGIDQ
jgi:hypothetical protein